MRAALALVIATACSTDGGAVADLASPIADLSVAAPDMTFACSSSAGDTPTCAGGPPCDPGCWCAPETSVILFDGGGGMRTPGHRQCVCGSNISLYTAEMSIGNEPFCCAGQICDPSIGQNAICTAGGDCYGPL
jgi:hypothetical protein